MLVTQNVINVHTSTIYSRREQTTMAPALTIGLWGFSIKNQIYNNKFHHKLMIFFILLLLTFRNAPKNSYFRSNLIKITINVMKIIKFSFPLFTNIISIVTQILKIKVLHHVLEKNNIHILCKFHYFFLTITKGNKQEFD